MSELEKLAAEFARIGLGSYYRNLSALSLMANDQLGRLFGRLSDEVLDTYHANFMLRWELDGRRLKELIERLEKANHGK